MLINHPSLALATWLSGCTSIWIFAILIGQLALVASETTTFEVNKPSRDCKSIVTTYIARYNVNNITYNYII